MDIVASESMSVKVHEGDTQICLFVGKGSRVSHAIVNSERSEVSFALFPQGGKTRSNRIELDCKEDKN